MGEFDNILQKRLREIINNKGWTYSEFLKNTGLLEYKDSIDNVYYGRSKDPRVSTVMQLSEALGVAVNCLMGRCSHTKEERALLNYYRSCGKHGQSVIELVAKYEAMSAKTERETAVKHRVPCMLTSTDIDDGILYDSCQVTEMDTIEESAYVAVQLASNLLSPIYCKNDILLFANRFPKHEEYGMFIKGDRAYIRQYLEEDGAYRLRSIHNSTKDMVLKRMDTVEYVGTCIGVVRN